jgi:hypothetical protein
MLQCPFYQTSIAFHSLLVLAGEIALFSRRTTSALFTGDRHVTSEEVLVHLVGNPELFLDTATPSAEAISVRAKDQFVHPPQEDSERLREYTAAGPLFNTIERGTVKLLTDGSRRFTPDLAVFAQD